jgi:hypothetical protein
MLRRMRTLDSLQFIMDPLIPEKVEVKLAVMPEDTAKALSQLHLADPSLEERRIHFLDTHDLLFFEQDLILRVRLAMAGNEGDATLKVRGDGAPAIAARFPATATGAKFEGDKTAGRDETPAFSITTKPSAEVLEGILQHGESVEGLLDAPGRTLFHELGAAAVPPASILRLGPIRSRTWKLKPEGFSSKITAELWDVAGTSLFELSDKVPPSGAAQLEAQLVALAASLGLRQLATSKTRFALEALRSSMA